jgi:hypothetical protein
METEAHGWQLPETGPVVSEHKPQEAGLEAKVLDSQMCSVFGFLGTHRTSTTAP